MHGAIPPLPQYAFMALCSVKKTQEQLHIYLPSCRIYRHDDDDDDDKLTEETTDFLFLVMTKKKKHVRPCGY
jgi:hypothetical protein